MALELTSRGLRRGVAALLSITLVALSLAACDDELRAGDYDQSCNAASDCIAIQTGQASCCGLSNCDDDAAINRVDFHQYLSDYRASASGCTGEACPLIECQPPAVGCVSGKCELLHVHLD